MFCSGTEVAVAGVSDDESGVAEADVAAGVYSDSVEVDVTVYVTLTAV